MSGRQSVSRPEEIVIDLKPLWKGRGLMMARHTNQVVHLLKETADLGVTSVRHRVGLESSPDYEVIYITASAPSQSVRARVSAVVRAISQGKVVAAS